MNISGIIYFVIIIIFVVRMVNKSKKVQKPSDSTEDKDMDISGKYLTPDKEKNIRDMAKFQNIVSEAKPEPKPEAKPEAKPEPKPEARPEIKLEALYNAIPTETKTATIYSQSPIKQEEKVTLGVPGTSRTPVASSTYGAPVASRTPGTYGTPGTSRASGTYGAPGTSGASGYNKVPVKKDNVSTQPNTRETDYQKMLSQMPLKTVTENKIMPEDKATTDNKINLKNMSVTENMAVSDNKIDLENKAVTENMAVSDNKIDLENKAITENNVITENNSVTEEFLKEEKLMAERLRSGNIVIKGQRLVKCKHCGQDNTIPATTREQYYCAGCKGALKYLIKM